MTITINKALSDAETHKMNGGWYDPTIDINLIREPKRFVYIFSISKREFVIERPPLHPTLRIPRCLPDERVKMVAKIPDPYNQAIQDPYSGRLVGAAHDGLRVAIDLVNPNNITNNVDWECPVQHAGEIATGHGCDLSRQGLFISLSENPSIQEVEKAEKKRHAYYDHLRREIDLMNEKDANYAASMNKDYGMMADYFGLSYPWHKVMKPMVACENCGDRIPQGAPWHVTPFGACITRWDLAVKAGLKKKEDVPEDYVWTKPSGQKAGR